MLPIINIPEKLIILYVFIQNYFYLGSISRDIMPLKMLFLFLFM